jgi:hypothetical protein
MSAGAQEFDAGLVADLDASAREQGDAPVQIGELPTLAIVQRRA